MAMAGEAVRLTEQESGPTFLWCDGKYNNTASVKHQSCGNQPPLGSTCFSSQYPFLYGESADHTMSRLLSGFHIYILTMPEEVAVRAESHQLFTLVPSFSRCCFPPAVNHPASARGSALRVPPGCCRLQLILITVNSAHQQQPDHRTVIQNIPLCSLFHFFLLCHCST